MENTISNTYEANQVLQTQKLLTLERQMKSGLGWFFWIAGLSLINTLIYNFGGNLNFVVGLGITQFIDGFTHGLAAEFTGNLVLAVRVFGFVMNTLVAGIFVLFGVLGRSRIKWAIITGMVIYLLDGLIFLAFGEWFSVFFHGLAFWGLWGGLKAINELNTFEASLALDELASLRTALTSPKKASEPISIPRMAKIAVIILLAIIVISFLLTLLFNVSSG